MNNGRTSGVAMSRNCHKTLLITSQRKGGPALVRARCFLRHLRHLTEFAVWACMCVATSLSVMAAAAREENTSTAAPLSDAIVRARADALIAQMAPEEKAGQLSQ